MRGSRAVNGDQGKRIRRLWLNSGRRVSIPAGIKAKEAEMGLSIASKA